VSSIRTSTWPRFTGCPSSTSTAVTAPPSSARTVAASSGSSDPDSVGPAVSVVSTATARFSGPMMAGGGPCVSASRSGLPHPTASMTPLNESATHIGHRNPCGLLDILSSIVCEGALIG
jgi:hypothetical protein